MYFNVSWATYFSIPLEQGLRLVVARLVSSWVHMYFSIPLEQGLRHILCQIGVCAVKYFSIPLEQGLRLLLRREPKWWLVF